MAREIVRETARPADRKLMGLIQHGDDFLKIELLRPAKSYYERALELDPDNEEIRGKIAECNKLLATERRTILLLLFIAVAVMVAAYLLL